MWKTGTLNNCWWECKTARPYWITVGQGWGEGWTARGHRGSFGEDRHSLKLD